MSVLERPRLTVAPLASGADHWEAYRLRFAWPQHDPDDRRRFAFADPRIVLDPWDVRSASTLLARAGGRPVGTLRLVVRRRREYLRMDPREWRLLGGALGLAPADVPRRTAVVSRVAVDLDASAADTVLDGLLRAAEAAARRWDLDLLLARTKAHDLRGRAALARAGHVELLRDLFAKRLEPGGSAAIGRAPSRSPSNDGDDELALGSTRPLVAGPA